MIGELSERERIILMMRGWGDNEQSYSAVDYLMTRNRTVELISPCVKNNRTF